MNRQPHRERPLRPRPVTHSHAFGTACHPCCRLWGSVDHDRYRRTAEPTPTPHVHVGPGVHVGTARYLRGQPPLMDPNAALNEIRSIVTDADVHLNGGTADEAFDRLADLVNGLDEWMSRGGFLPAAWQQHR